MSETKTTTPEISVGDRVIVRGQGYPALTVHKIVETSGYEPAAIFAEGGFWRVSQLEKVQP